MLQQTHFKRAFIGLGSNLADPDAQIHKAFAELGKLPRTRLLAQSSLYRSAPVGYADQPDFINAVAEIETGLEPHQLLEVLLDMEHRHGRVREFRNAPRILDLDILLYNDLACHEHGLTLPHPRMHERAFVLQPLHEIAPQCVIGGHGPVADCLEKCAGQRVERICV
ncbi:MAG: 2-amino-4-hydroxy-6-hydroxymethyldihydropteridine diphosphokinase [Sulfuricella sp.]|nr:2-amino-4-hydroxy-6-hydroxymethyldihydropteridine diphosphokinase [Sulfuricella sp.]